MLADMELECGICYRPYNSGRRCPRLLGCKHRFCESCLLRQGASTRPAGESDSQPGIVCALCRHHTVLAEAGLRENLPVDEELLERLMAAGTLEGTASDDEDDEEPETETDGQSKEESLPRTRRGRMWRAVKKLCCKIRGQDRRGCITDAEMRDLALMSCYMI
ncbi:RING finger protein 227 [Salminus brasiliensis]|uniref:RING finger protein 227 n=1 Tax=Salminus brasiliensis TaxID=930266 RepID=UPI003B838F74